MCNHGILWYTSINLNKMNWKKTFMWVKWLISIIHEFSFCKLLKIWGKATAIRCKFLHYGVVLVLLSFSPVVTLSNGIDLIESSVRSDDFHLLFSFDLIFIASLDYPGKLTNFVISSTKNKCSSFIAIFVHRMVKWVQHSSKKMFLYMRVIKDS